MTSEAVLQWAGSGAIAAIVVALVGLVQKRTDLKAARPRDTAETNAISLDAQGKTVDRLSAENARLDRLFQAANLDLETAMTDLRHAVKRIDHLEDELKDEREQNAWFRSQMEGWLTARGQPIPEWWKPTNPPAAT